MAEQTLKSHNTSLLPAQAADVISYYDKHDNERSLKNNWKRKKSLGQVAFDTTRRLHSILPSGEALLTADEAAAGLEYYQESLQDKTVEKIPEDVSPWPIEPTDSQYEKIFAEVDKGVVPLDEAYAHVMHEIPAHWNQKPHQ